jgi:cytochrome c-type biogenesis protein CcmF
MESSSYDTDLQITFLASLYGAGAAAYGALEKKPEFVESGRYAMLLTWPLLTVSSAAIIWLLTTGHYEIGYVYSVTSNAMPTYLKVTALWGGQKGSLVFWAWLMAAFASAASLRKWDRDRELLPWFIVVTMITLGFFVSMIIFFENPFARSWLTAQGQQVAAMLQPAGAVPIIPADGKGLNPLLRHPGMIIHPPALYLGFVAYVIPYAFAMAALITRRADDRWIRITRRWTLVAWIFLSLGLILGGRWAYDVLGWGGYWAWDPVEIAALLPWLAGTAFLHSVMVQEKKGMLKHWNMVLIILTYALVIFGTFLSRSGVLSSVHAFGTSIIGPMFLAFIAVTFLVSLGLLIYRWEMLKGENFLTSMFSREALFLLNNFLFMGILIVSFWGVIFPLISELITGQKITVGPPFYERANGPLGLGLLLLMAIAPLSAYSSRTWVTIGRSFWKPALVSIAATVALMFAGVRNPVALLGYSAATLVAAVTLYEFWRGALARHRQHGESFPVALWHLARINPRRYGGYIIHLGVVLMAFGIIGIEVYQTETQATLAPGEQITLNRYVMTYDDLSDFDSGDGRRVTRAVVSVYKDGELVDEIYPRRDYYYDSQQAVTIPGTRSRLADDFYVILVGLDPGSPLEATFKVYHNPLVNLVWIGGAVFTIGTIVALLSNRGRRRARKKASS